MAQSMSVLRLPARVDPRHRPHPRPPGEPCSVVDEVAQVAPAVQPQAAVAFQSPAVGIAEERLSACFGELADRLEPPLTDRQTT
jgi:hypothetical protein